MLTLITPVSLLHSGILYFFIFLNCDDLNLHVYFPNVVYELLKEKGVSVSYSAQKLII